MPWLLICYPLLSHVAALLRSQPLAAMAMAVFIAIPLEPALRRGSLSAWLTVAACIGGLLLAALKGHAIALMYLPPVLIPLSVLTVFAFSLRTGGTPVVSQIATQIRGAPLPVELQVYSRQVTWYWVIFLACLATGDLLLALFASLTLWSTVTNVVQYVLIGAMFIIEYVYRRWRFRHLQHESILRFVVGLFSSRVNRP